VSLATPACPCRPWLVVEVCLTAVIRRGRELCSSLWIEAGFDAKIKKGKPISRSPSFSLPILYFLRRRQQVPS
jgi:hypothetical protein